MWDLVWGTAIVGQISVGIDQYLLFFLGLEEARNFVVDTEAGREGCIPPLWVRPDTEFVLGWAVEWTP